MIDIDRSAMLEHFSYQAFIPHLRQAFADDVTAPARSHHEVGGTTLLLMPAWTDRHLGMKTVTVAPSNRDRGLPSVHATYALFDAVTGEPRARLDGRTLTNLRTAAASALAADVLAPADASRLLMIGHGTLAPELIRAHASVRPITTVRVHGRDAHRVRAWLSANDFGDLKVEESRHLADDIDQFADIISCATTSSTPVFPGASVHSRQHVDLVGSYQPHTREADDDLMQHAFVLVDTDMARTESGDVALPLETGVLTEDRIIGTLHDVARTTMRPPPQDATTVFKSVGVALEDLALAVFLLGAVPKAEETR